MPHLYRLCAGPCTAPLRSQGPYRPDLDLAEPGYGMRRGHLDGLLQAVTLEHVVPADDLLGLGERPVADQDLAVAHQHRLGLLGGPEPVAVQPDAARDHVVEPGKAAHVVGVAVLRGIRCLVLGEAARVDADQHHELHVVSDPRGTYAITTNGSPAKDSPAFIPPEWARPAGDAPARPGQAGRRRRSTPAEPRRPGAPARQPSPAACRAGSRARQTRSASAWPSARGP